MTHNAIPASCGRYCSMPVGCSSLAKERYRKLPFLAYIGFDWKTRFFRRADLSIGILHGRHTACLYSFHQAGGRCGEL
jgi:hypothetical protein